MSLFRPEAMRRAQSPEQLDALLHVTSPGTWLALTGCGLVLALLVAWALLGEVPVRVRGEGLLLPQGGLVAVPAPRSGVVAAVETAPGRVLAPGDPVVVLGGSGAATSRAGGSAPTTVPALVGGRTAQVLVRAGALVSGGQVLAWVEPTGRPLVAEVFLPLGASPEVHAGQAVEVQPADAAASVSGFIEGRLSTISAYPAGEAEIAGTLGDAHLAAALVAAGDVLPARVTLETAPAEPGGLRWSDGGHSAPGVGSGTPVRVAVVVARFHPVQWVFRGA